MPLPLRSASFWNDVPGTTCRANSRYSLRDFQCRKKTRGLSQSFLEFRLRTGVSHDAGTDVKMDDTVFANRSANGNVQLAFAVKAEITDRAAVRPARNGFELVNNFHRAEF